MALYWKLIRASVAAQMEYKFSFLFSTLLMMVLQALDFLLIAAILLKFDTIKGWNLYEVGYLYAISMMVLSLYRTLCNEIHAFEKYTVQGEFDQLLTRPVSPLLNLFSRSLYLHQIGGFLQGIVVLAVSLWGLYGQGVSVAKALWFLPVSIVSGSLIVLALGLATATIAFWTVRIADFLPFTVYAPINASSYPMHIYPGWLKGLLFSVLPVAFIAYVPSLYLFDKGGAWWYLLLTPLVAAVALGLALAFWRFGIKRYHSTGN
ncbi:MAG TPA: ABC-2 family transporter protein [Bacilli bacterium]|nr:ABC-2 family transporter protein [Bacilli bacterium]